MGKRRLPFFSADECSAGRFSEKERDKVWKDYMEMIMNEKNDWDYNVEGDTVEVPVDFVSRVWVVQVLSGIEP